MPNQSAEEQEIVEALIDALKAAGYRVVRGSDLEVKRTDRRPHADTATYSFKIGQNKDAPKVMIIEDEL